MALACGQKLNAQFPRFMKGEAAMEAIPYGMLVASRLQAQGQTNDRGHTTRNRLAITFRYLRRRILILARRGFRAATRNNPEQQKHADGA